MDDIKNLTWRDVLDAYPVVGTGGSLQEMHEKCISIGYEYFAFNGTIYHVNPYGDRRPIETLYKTVNLGL